MVRKAKGGMEAELFEQETKTTGGENMKTFKTYETVSDMDECMKKPIVVHAKQMKEEFNVKTLEGNYKIGKPGDYLMQGIESELYVCDKHIFEKSYDWI